MTKPQEDFADRVTARREELDMTKIQLAKAAATTWDAINKIENGVTKQPRDVYALAKALQVNPAWLVFGGKYAPKTIPTKEKTT